MKLLITGINGFVARHFLSLLASQPGQFEIVGLGRAKEFDAANIYPGIRYICVDLLDKEKVGEIIRSFKPTHLLHLASVSSVGHSWKFPHESFVNNTNIFLNLVDQLRLLDINCRILSIGSSEEYGNVDTSMLPLSEESMLRPISPYAIARVSQEMISQIYANGYGMDIVMTRSFNHIGPGQKDIFVIPSFARQLVSISRQPSGNHKVITGDLSITRDFVDVRDVVRAYFMLLISGKKGEIYNICSGNGISLKQIMDKMCGILEIDVEMEQDPTLIRPNDNKIIIGSPGKIHDAIGWETSISIDESLGDIIQWWKDRA
jgi:GDP-4-dehydro-6-deoxy-D-mannose reductase